jgi:DMSO/TMAO reductase YedYZ molybdopterin-dependent catalytic subunit
MPRRLVNLGLLALVAVLLVTGVVSWLVPVTAAEPLVFVHRLAGIALVLLAGWKYVIARRSLRRRGFATPSVWVGIGGALAAASALSFGIAWTAGLASFDRPFAYSALSLHVIAGMGLAALVTAHALLRGERRPPLVSLADRRAALNGLGLLAVSIAATSVMDRLALPRRATGSRHAGSFNGNAFPVTIWSFDTVPAVDLATWKLSLRGPQGRSAAITYGEIAALPHRDISAVIDCTGGWWSEQAWSGVGLPDLLDVIGMRSNATRVEVVSVTGHRWTFDRREIDRAILATHVGGEPLSAAHGHPLRLVVPDLRGFLWIKWVGEVVAA